MNRSARREQASRSKKNVIRLDHESWFTITDDTSCPMSKDELAAVHAAIDDIAEKFNLHTVNAPKH